MWWRRLLQQPQGGSRRSRFECNSSSSLVRDHSSKTKCFLSFFSKIFGVNFTFKSFTAFFLAATLGTRDFNSNFWSSVSFHNPQLPSLCQCCNYMISSHFLALAICSVKPHNGFNLLVILAVGPRGHSNPTYDYHLQPVSLNGSDLMCEKGQAGGQKDGHRVGHMQGNGHLLEMQTDSVIST